MKCGRQIFLPLKKKKNQKEEKCGTVGGRQLGDGEKGCGVMESHMLGERKKESTWYSQEGAGQGGDAGECQVGTWSMEVMRCVTCINLFLSLGDAVYAGRPEQQLQQ